MLKIYLITVVFFLISCELIALRAKILLQESGEYEVSKKSKKSLFIGNLRVILIGLIPICNLVMGIVFLVMFIFVPSDNIIRMFTEG